MSATDEIVSVILDPIKSLRLRTKGWTRRQKSFPVIPRITQLLKRISLKPGLLTTIIFVIYGFNDTKN